VNTDQQPYPIRIQGFDDQKLKNTAEKLVKFLFLTNIAIYLSLGLQGRSSYRRSLQPSKENIQHFKKRNLSTFFYFIRIQGLNLDPIRMLIKTRIQNTVYNHIRSVDSDLDFIGIQIPDFN
jgi:hypothetical protein